MGGWRRASSIGLAMSIAAGCGGAQSPDIREVGAPQVHQGRVVAARGPVVPQRGDACVVEVLRTDDAYYNCRIRVECGGDMVYGLADGGYNACYRQGEDLVFARDRNGTRVDGDPRLYFDLAGGRVFVSDDAPDVELEIDLSGLPQDYEGPSAPPPDAMPGA
ncbi:hypothetical protein [Sandaracinus amylolyticus]|uniref:hypothetical protein n=1 Tax=Sandaracinus amylolyticus TaxID=927083 RepID=UPI001F3C7E1D|nr:hypothetical protein [Sandaracinus amylolyticus]